MGDTRYHHDTRGVRIGTSIENAGKYRVDENEMGEMRHCELGLVAVGADGVFFANGGGGVCNDDLYGRRISS